MQTSNDSRNVLIAVTLSTIVLVGWSLLAPKSQVQQTSQKTPPKTRPLVSSNSIPQAVPVQSLSKALKDTPRVEIQTEKLQGSISLRGGRLDSLILRKYTKTTDKDSGNIRLFSPVDTEKPYFVGTGWVGGKGDVPSTKTLWQADGKKLSVKTPVTLSWKNTKGVLFKKIFSIDENYMISVRQVVENASSSAVTLANYALIARGGIEEDKNSLYILHEGPIGVLEDTLEEIGYDDLRDGTKRFTSKGGWVGITDKFWLVSVIPEQNSTIDATYRYIARGRNLYQVDFKNTATALRPGENFSYTIRIFSGAKEVSIIDKYKKAYAIPMFDRSIDFGWFYFLTKPFFYILNFFSKALGNVGLAILALTVLVKAILFPLASKSYRSMAKMKVLAPRMQELKARYKDDRMGLNKAMMELYKAEKVNPMSGCLPILVQIPVFFSLYKVLYVTLEMRQAPFFGWIRDLSVPDPLGILTGFGLIDWTVPPALAFLNIGIWPLVMGLTMYLQQRLNPSPQDPIQAKVFAFMPIMFTFLLAHFPAGLVIYWAWNNILSIAQQYMIQKQTIG